MITLLTLKTSNLSCFLFKAEVENEEYSHHVTAYHFSRLQTETLVA